VRAGGHSASGREGTRRTAARGSRHTRRATVGKPTKARYRHTLNALKGTQTRKQQAGKGKPRERKIPLERAQMNANAFTLARAGVACRLSHQRPAQLRGQHSTGFREKRRGVLRGVEEGRSTRRVGCDLHGVGDGDGVVTNDEMNPNSGLTYKCLLYRVIQIQCSFRHSSPP